MAVDIKEIQKRAEAFNLGSVYCGVAIKMVLTKDIPALIAAVEESRRAEQILAGALEAKKARIEELEREIATITKTHVYDTNMTLFNENARLKKALVKMKECEYDYECEEHGMRVTIYFVPEYLIDEALKGER